MCIRDRYQEQVQIVTTNPDIKTVADLAGKKVSIGAAGSGVYFNAIDAVSYTHRDVYKRQARPAPPWTSCPPRWRSP